jgi:hypothetical protein
MPKSNKRAILAGILFLSSLPLLAVTNQFRGVNWADTRDNFQTGVLYLSGLSSTDTYSSASITADRIISQFMSKLGSNGVRMPINEATVSNYWSTYTGAIDAAISKGKVVLCYWGKSSGANPVDMNAFWNMWKTVVDKYTNNANCYFEIFNEPSGYNKTDLCNLYDNWLKKYPSVPKNRVILDGSGLAMNVPDVGADSRFNGCFLAVHEYSFFGSSSSTKESDWENQIKAFVGNYADRTICTEWGGPMSPGSKNGISYDYLDYSKSPTNYFEAYVRGVSNQLRNWKMGSFYWPGLRDGDWYSMTKKSGSGANITLSIPNQSGLDRLHYSWTDTIPVSVSPVKTTRLSDLKIYRGESTLRIEFTAPHSGLTSLKLFNLNGNVVKTMSFQAGAGGICSRSFDCSGIPEGYYPVKLENGGSAVNMSKVLLTR